MRRAGTRRLLIAKESSGEAALAGGRMDVIPVQDLGEAVSVLKGERVVPPLRVDIDALGSGDAKTTREEALELAHVRGCHAAKRALVVAAAGGHDLLFVGPPGTGKTMLARRLLGILPPLETDEILEITRVHGSAGVASAGGIVRQRPFRAPHHTISYAGLVGGGSHGPRPGEVSLAHRGVLFLDELPEFPPRALEALREPLETRTIHVARIWGSSVLPADFQLVAAMNPCPCGHLYDRRRQCRCSDRLRAAYAARISGPLLDRIDLQVTVHPPSAESLLESTAEEGSLTTEQAAEAVLRARAMQRGRGRELNARLSQGALEKACALDRDAHLLLVDAARTWVLSARGIVKAKRVARTIADLAGRDRVVAEDVAEALAMCRLDELRGEPLAPALHAGPGT